MTLEKFLKKLDCDYCVKFNTMDYFLGLSINIESTMITYDIRDIGTDRKIKKFLYKNGYLIIFSSRSVYNRVVRLVVVAPDEKPFFEIYNKYEKKSVHECEAMGNWLFKKGLAEKRNKIFYEIMAKNEKKCRVALEM